MAASSSSSSSSAEYDVFISFRGDDTRDTITSHLYASFVQNNIKAFIDQVELEKGHPITPALKNAIQKSKISVIIFSQDYGTSPWCLDELVHILHCRKINGQIVLPVFYRVEPTDVEKQKGRYETSFAAHELRFAADLRRVEIWRESLREAASLCGWDSQVVGSEAKLVKKIIKFVTEKLSCAQPEDDYLTGYVGIEKRYKNIKDLFEIDDSKDQDLCIVGIWGPGGIGKTTLARIIYQRLYNDFEACFFIEDLRVDWGQGCKRYYYSKNIHFDHKLQRGKKVLVILDNVNDSEQLEQLTIDSKQFGPGSRIVVTTRDMQIIRNIVDHTYKVEKLDFEEALQLFCLNALGKANMESSCIHTLCKSIINYTEGIPLALKVLSSFLRGKKKENWDAELNKLKECPDKNIMNILRTSYDGLDKMQKCIFLDVACFFKNTLRGDTERILKACGLYPETGLDDLVDKSLIYINMDDILCVHDLLQQMAFTVVNSETELENRSRLWISQDACHVLETNRGTTSIEGIFLDMSVIGRIEYDSFSFQSMFKLRLLKIFHSDVRKNCHVSTKGDICDLQVLPSSLRYLHWEAFPWKSFPQSFRPQNLVELNLPFSNVVQLWNGTQPLTNLMKIDLSDSKNLIELPDLSQALKLEHVYLEHCTSFREVPSSLENLCELKTLNLNGCLLIHEFPNLPRSIVCLVLSGTAIKLVPQSIMKLGLLEILNLSGCQNLAFLPNFSTMPSLKAITLPKRRISRNKSEIFQYGTPEFDTIQVFQREVNDDAQGFTSKSSVNALHPMLYSIYNHGLPISRAIVSISRTVLTKYLATFYGRQAQNLMFFNCLGFWGEFLSDELSTFKLHSEKIVSSEFTSVIPMETNKGFCCVRDNTIPDFFDHQCNGDSLSVILESQPKSKILGYAVCAVVDFDFSDLDSIGCNTLQMLCEDSYKEYNLFCELTMGGTPLQKHTYYNSDSIFLETLKDSFRFWAGLDGDSICSARVIKCGVRIIYDDELVSPQLETLTATRSGYNSGFAIPVANAPPRTWRKCLA